VSLEGIRAAKVSLVLFERETGELTMASMQIAPHIGCDFSLEFQSDAEATFIEQCLFLVDPHFTVRVGIDLLYLCR
jgi:hypothetical protein